MSAIIISMDGAAMPVGQVTDLAVRTRSALAEMQAAGKKRDEVAKEFETAESAYADKREKARRLIVELHNSRPHGATTKWTSEQAECGQRLVQQLLKEAGAADPDAEHAALREGNNASQRRRRARQRGAIANDKSDVIRDQRSEVEPQNEPNPAPDRLAMAREAVKTLNAEELAEFTAWFAEEFDPDLTCEDCITFLHKVAEGLGFKSRELHNGAVVEFRQPLTADAAYQLVARGAGLVDAGGDNNPAAEREEPHDGSVIDDPAAELRQRMTGSVIPQSELPRANGADESSPE